MAELAGEDLATKEGPGLPLFCDPRADSRAVIFGAVAIMIVGVARRFQMLPRVEAASEKGLGEAFNVARAFARTGTIADAFVLGQGPTAHLMPLPAFIAGTIYRVFGIHSSTSGLILTAFALCFVFTSFWLLFIGFRELGTPSSGRLLALALVCLLPINVMLEDIWFRLWDGGMAVAAGALMLYVVLRVDRREVIGIWSVTVIALLAAVTLFVSPPFGLAGYCCAGLLMVRRLPARRWPATTAIAAAALIAVLAPWAIRNEIVMGQPVLLRDNFGLELGQAYASSLVDSTDADGGIKRRHQTIHPWASRTAYRKMVEAGGEIAYAAQMKADAVMWIQTHPTDALRLTQRHLRMMTFPPLTLPNDPSPNGLAYIDRVLVYRIIAGLGFLSIAYAIARGGRRYHYAVIMTLVTILPYLVVEANIRYRYAIFALLTFFAADLLARLAVVAKARAPREPHNAL